MEITSPILSVLLIALSLVATVAGDVSDKCLGCICQASTKCQKDIGCTEAGVCGPLLISWPYWADAGKNVIVGTSPSAQNAYSQCANDLYCAGVTVRSYMKKYEQDCNGDGAINCDDYARIHKLGPHSCQSQSFSQTPFGQQYEDCKATVHPE